MWYNIGMKGKKYEAEIKEKARALLTMNTPSFVAEKLNIPYRTVKDWQREFESTDVDFAEVRNKKKEQFVSDAWKIIELGNKLLERRLNRAVESENEIDEMISDIEQQPLREVGNEEKAQFIRQLNKVKIDDVRAITTVLGTMYDKQALANKEATQIVSGEITVKKFEDL